MDYLDLKANEVDEIITLISEIKTKYDTAVTPEFLINSRFYASFLPERVQKLYRKMKVDSEHSGITLLRGFPFQETRKTPESWNYSESYAPKMDLDYLGVLLSSCLGYIYGWSTQQAGKLIHDLIPREGKGESQTGYGSTSTLLMHTEDSFHDLRAEFVCMFGLRNEDYVPTTLTSVRDLILEQEVWDGLYHSQLDLLPDESHLDNAQKAENHVDDIKNEASKMSTFYGCREFPYICYDPAYTDFQKATDSQSTAYDALNKEIDRKTFDVAIKPGDFCIVDNRKVVHGRRAFKPKFDGSDRWLKRINITSNIRKSAGQRKDIKTRVIGG